LWSGQPFATTLPPPLLARGRGGGLAAAFAKKSGRAIAFSLAALLWAPPEY
jgi:hypothetical protein